MAVAPSGSIDFWSCQLTPGLVGGAAASLIVPEGRVLCITSITAQGCPAQVRCRRGSLCSTHLLHLAGQPGSTREAQRLQLQSRLRGQQPAGVRRWQLASRCHHQRASCTNSTAVASRFGSLAAFVSDRATGWRGRHSWDGRAPVPARHLWIRRSAGSTLTHPALPLVPPRLPALPQSMQRFPLWTDAVLTLAVSAGNRPPAQLWRSDWVRHKYDSVRMYWVPHFGGACCSPHVLLRWEATLVASGWGRGWGTALRGMRGGRGWTPASEPSGRL
jgi:hypothetical protein